MKITFLTGHLKEPLIVSTLRERFVDKNGVNCLRLKKAMFRMINSSFQKNSISVGYTVVNIYSCILQNDILLRFLCGCAK